MSYIIILFSMILGWNDFNKISQVNHHKNEADKAIKAEDYPTAIDAYKILIDSLQVNEESLLLNMANAYYHTSDTTNAAYFYSRLIDSDDPKVRSQAFQQLGVISQQQNKMEASLEHFKNALKSNPANEDARYNYEVLKKLMEQQQQQDQENQENQEDQDKENKNEEDQKNQEQKDQQKKEEEQKKEEQQQQEQEKGEQEQNQEEESEKQQQPGEDQQKETPEEGEENEMPPSRKEKLEELNLTEEKARMILEAMKNNEMQYLQQMQRKATKKPDSDKPDW